MSDIDVSGVRIRNEYDDPANGDHVVVENVGRVDEHITRTPNPQRAADIAEIAFIKAQYPTVLAKARAILANPGTAPDFTVAERKVILAVVVIDVGQRFRNGS